MNYKTLILLGGAFAVLVAAFFLVKPNRPTVGSSGAEVGKALIRDFKPDEARVIKLAKGDCTIELARKSDRWVVSSKDDRPADETRVTTLLDAVRDAKVKDTRAGSQDRFDLDEKHRLSLSVLGADDKELASLQSGKSPGYGSGFVLKHNRILEIDQDFGEKAQVITENEKKVLSVDKWYDMKLLRVASDEVIDVAFQKGDEKWRIQKVIPGEGPVKPKPREPAKKDEAKPDEEGEAKKEAPKAEEKQHESQAEPAQQDDVKKDADKPDEKKDEAKEEKKPVWHVTEPEDAEADESACSSVCSTVSWLDAKGYADDVKPEEQGLDKPIATTKLVLKDGTTHTLVFGKYVKDEKSDYESYVVAKLDGKPQVWKIGKTDFENLTKPLDKLKKAKEEPKTDDKKDEEKAERKEEGSTPEQKDTPTDEAKKDEAPVEPAQKDGENKTE